MSRDILERAAEALNRHTSIGDRIVLDEGALSGDKWHPTEARLVLRALDTIHRMSQTDAGADRWEGRDPEGYQVAHWYGDDAEEHAREWLAARQGDDEPTDDEPTDEPKRCSHIDSIGARCRMNEGHKPFGHYGRPDSAGTCDHDGCVRLPYHAAHHLLADGTEVSA